ncbi:hypothetical protein AB0P21_37985 [Kribbella sp. NPDC056861]|uniref:hypothetical protein n=1 Tax=Kribbella sp. NPDC056861 TaxID=3154857 RepID=UPI00344A5AC6
MRKTIAAGTAALILLGGAQLPAWAASGPEAPTDLQISWTDAANGRLKLSWTDGGEANKVRVEYQDADALVLLATTKPGEANELSVRSTSVYANRVARIVVVTRDEAGVESAAAVSP